MELTENLASLKGVGPATAKLFESIGVHNIGDLLDFFPRRYNDYSDLLTVSRLKPGQVSFKAKISHAKPRYVRRGLHITEAIASDQTGSVKLVWFNQPYRAAAIKAETEYYISGKLELSRQQFAVMNPSAELAGDFPLHTARIVPVYKEKKGISSNLIRRTLYQVIKLADLLPDPLPPEIRKKYNLINYGQAVLELHFPSSRENFAVARHTIGFIEVFELMLASSLQKMANQALDAPKINFDLSIAKKFVESLPFKLTDDQRRAAWQIYQDIDSEKPMNRLLEGDVGSGKTVVAGMAALMANHQDFQAALMAPTELLARQHAETLSQMFTSVGRAADIGLLVGSLKPAQKKVAHERIKSGHIKFVIGTQALIQEKVVLQKLGLLVVDEQHRFGVEQRKTLLSKTKLMPHVLSMTATPIPRSLALTLYGDLDISTLNVMPSGRKPIMTEVISPNSREAMYQKVDSEIKAGRQVYVVCPLIKDGEAKSVAAPSAEEMFNKLSKTVFKHRRVGLVHGQLKDSDKDQMMQDFAARKLDILVSTTVIEVGISIANASVMVIEGADRFGLAQLHQLRGRVGRGSDQGYCYLVPSDSRAPSARLQALVHSNDGFKLAELDLELRGPGAIYGTLQHGELDLRIAKLSDTKLLAAARQAVAYFLNNNFKLDKYPELKRRVRAAQAVITLN